MHSMDTPDVRPCPFCGETILKVARKCRHCRTWINDSQHTAANQLLTHANTSFLEPATLKNASATSSASSLESAAAQRDSRRERNHLGLGIVAGFLALVIMYFVFNPLLRSSKLPEEPQSRAMTPEEQRTILQLQNVWRETCVRRGYDAYSQECGAYVLEKTIEARKDAGLWP